MSRFAVVTATFNADVEMLGRQMAGLAGAAAVVLVDDGSAPPRRQSVRELAAGLPGVLLVEQPRNSGLAAALNAGARAALERVPDCEYLLFLDQDTEPGPDGARRLVAAAAAQRAADSRTALVGPMMVDAATGLSHGVHVIRGWRWRRLQPPAGSAPVRCASVNGSGMVVAVEAWRALGGFEEALFIDHVDSEYSFRAAHAGYALYVAPAVRFLHRMGERSLRFWVGHWRVWPYRAPERHYYLVRNACLLMRRTYVPRVWKGWAAPKLVSTLLAHLFFDRERFRQTTAMVRGACDGLRADASAAP